MELPARAAYHRHMPGTIMNQQVGDQSPALLVIGADRWDALAEITVEPHDGPTDRSPVIRSVLGVRRHHDAIHHMPAEHVDVLGLASTRIGRRAQHGTQPPLRQLSLQTGRQRGEERMADGRHDDADGVGAVMIQVAGELVRHIIERTHGFGDALAHVIGHAPGTIHHQRHRTQRHPGLFGHITHPDHAPTPSFAVTI